MLSIDEPKNKNYCAVIVALEKFTILPNCDNVKAALVFGNSVIVGKETQPGDVGMYFPVETALTAQFLGANNLYQKPEYGNVDPSKKGYFDSHGRIKAVKFRGHKSEGFWIPLTSLAYTGIPVSELVVGMEFDKLNEFEICHKYIPKRNKVSNPCTKRGRQPRAEDKIVEGQFAFHIDTANLRRNIQRIEPHQWISISDKWHGTSAVFSNILIFRFLSRLEQFAKWLNGITLFGFQLFPIEVQGTKYGYTWSSRRVVKGVDGREKANSVHYYDSDIWGTVFREVIDSIPKGFTLYGEIVGYTPDGKIIQKGYHYDCQPGTHRFLVYRVTNTNEDGKVLELGWLQMKAFCEKYGLEMVKELYYGRADGYFPTERPKPENYYSTDWTPTMNLSDWRDGFLAKLEAEYVTDKMCQYNNFEVPAEGVVVKIERLDEAESYKCKNFAFLAYETKMLDEGVEDIETEQSESEDSPEDEQLAA